MREIRLWSPNLRELDPAHVLECEPSETHHFSNVLRGKVGFEVILMDGLGYEAKAVCIEKDKRRALFRIEESLQISSAPPPLTLLGPIPKGRRFPYMLEKCQELGLRSWGPLATEHSVREELSPAGREKIKERLRDACKQSRNPWLLELSPEQALEQAFALPHNKVVLDVDAPPYESLPTWPTDEPVQLFYGPEAGWSDGERELFRKAGAVFLGLSSHHLRMETAAVVGTAMVLEKLNRRSTAGF